MIAARVRGGTNAGIKRSVEPGIDKCDCGGFISQARAEKGAKKCLRCEDEK